MTEQEKKNLAALKTQLATGEQEAEDLKRASEEALEKMVESAAERDGLLETAVSELEKSDLSLLDTKKTLAELQAKLLKGDGKLLSDTAIEKLRKELEERDGNMLSDGVTVMQTLLQRILKSLKVLGCAYHLCDGSQTPPREHVTCRVCAAIWEVSEAIGVIERDYGGPRKEKEPGSDDKEIAYGGDPEPAQDT